ncbi:MAG: hypothetical protein M3394_03315 [Actinomycetota bacterium]|nr:hypothetical protein [Actinomycetota bacterium]
MAHDDHAFKTRFSARLWTELDAFCEMFGISVNKFVVEAVQAALDAKTADPEVRARLDAELGELSATVARLLDKQRQSAHR